MTQTPPIKPRALYIVALPIGNLGDITKRACDILEAVDVIAAEDTRTCKELLNQLQIKFKRLIAYHNHNEHDSSNGIIKLLEEGQSIALVSDAGTPSISDPGHDLLNKCFEKQIPVYPIAGASSLTAALSVCPIGGVEHFFGGFLSSKTTERKKQLQSYRNIPAKLVFFESPHRVLEHLNDALEIFGDIPTFIGREMTKKFEEYTLHPLTELIRHFKEIEPRGEFVIVYSHRPIETKDVEVLKAEIKILLDQGMKTKDIQAQLKSESHLTRQELFDLIQSVKSSP